MAIVDITEYQTLARDANNGIVPTGQEPATLNQQVAIGGASTPSSAFNGTTRLIRVHTDAPCRIQIGADPTAAATTQRMGANATEYFGVRGGHKLAVITTT